MKEEEGKKEDEEEKKVRENTEPNISESKR